MKNVWPQVPTEHTFYLGDTLTIPSQQETLESTVKGHHSKGEGEKEASRGEVVKRGSLHV